MIVFDGLAAALLVAGIVVAALKAATHHVVSDGKIL